MASDRLMFDWPLESGRVALVAGSEVPTEDVIWIVEQWLTIKKAEIARRATAHPDKGGSTERMAEVNAARDDGVRARGGGDGG